MRLDEIRNPFSQSIEPRVLYHGTVNGFDKFNRSPHGIYVTPVYGWAKEHYGGHVIPVYANITKILRIDWDDRRSDYFYDRDYDAITKLLNELSVEGYNAIDFGGESESMVLFNNIDIVNADTGNPM